MKMSDVIFQNDNKPADVVVFDQYCPCHPIDEYLFLFFVDFSLLGIHSWFIHTLFI
jgi:hypothetical protein